MTPGVAAEIRAAVEGETRRCADIADRVGREAREDGALQEAAWTIRNLILCRSVAPPPTPDPGSPEVART